MKNNLFFTIYFSFFFFMEAAEASEAPTSLEPLPHGAKTILPYGFSLNLWFVFLFLFCLISAVLGWFLYKRFKKAKKEVIAEVNLPLEVYKKVSALKPEEPFLKKQQENYFYELGFNLRHYIELKTKVSATDLTFKELKEPLRKELSSLGLDSKDLLSFLEKSEFIKFSEKMVNLKEAGDYQGDVLRWLDEIAKLSKEKEDKENEKKRKNKKKKKKEGTGYAY